MGKDGCGSSICGAGSACDRLELCSTFMGEFIKFEETAGRLSMFLEEGPSRQTSLMELPNLEHNWQLCLMSEAIPAESTELGLDCWQLV